MPAKKTTKKPMSEAAYCEALAKQMGVTKSEAKKFLDAQEATIAKGLKAHGAVRTPLGKLEVKKVPAKKGGKKMYMPALGREIVTKDKPASKKVKFLAKKGFRENL